MSTVKPRDIYIIRDQGNGNQRTVVYGEQLLKNCPPHVMKTLGSLHYKTLENLPYNGKVQPAKVGALLITKTQTIG